MRIYSPIWEGMNIEMKSWHGLFFLWLRCLTSFTNNVLYSSVLMLPQLCSGWLTMHICHRGRPDSPVPQFRLPETCISLACHCGLAIGSGVSLSSIYVWERRQITCANMAARVLPVTIFSDREVQAGRGSTCTKYTSFKEERLIGNIHLLLGKHYCRFQYL